MKRKRLIVLALVVLGGMLLFVIIDKPPAVPAVMILPPGPLVLKSGRVPDRWIPAKWGWLHRVCQFFLGAPRQVGFNVQCIETSETVASIAARLSLGQPQAQSNGVSVWILPDGTLRPIKGTGRMASMARVITGNQYQATVSVVDTSAIRSADLYARLEKEHIDLSTRLVVAAKGQTNFVAAMRAQLPYDHALFVLDVRQPDLATNRMEFVITADEMDPAGNIVRRKPVGK